ncbi:MAG: hypothetical protein HZA91_02820 [Verrucomicrobia bacterium]|nr:hypothetical protein [Verrucomicrobiota bacterium]
MQSLVLAAALSAAFGVTNETAVIRHAALVSATLPLPAGAARDAAQLRVVGYDDLSMAAQIAPLASWPDGSLKWVRAIFTTDLEPSESKRWSLMTGRSTARPKRPARARVEEGGVVLDTGIFRYRAGDWLGPLTLRTADSAPFVAQPPDKVAVESSGPIMAAAVREGVLARDGDAIARYRERFAVVAGQPGVRVSVTVEPTTGRDSISIRCLSLNVRPAPSSLRNIAIGTTDGARQFEPGKAWRLEQPLIPATVASDRQHPGWINWRGDGDAVFFGVEGFWRLAPQALDLQADGSARYEMHSSAARARTLRGGEVFTRRFMLWFHRSGDDFGEGLAEVMQPLRVALPGDGAPSE